jgi:hypothetical protein
MKYFKILTKYLLKIKIHTVSPTLIIISIATVAIVSYMLPIGHLYGALAQTSSSSGKYGGNFPGKGPGGNNQFPGKGPGGHNP